MAEQARSLDGVLRFENSNNIRLTLGSGLLTIDSYQLDDPSLSYTVSLLRLALSGNV